MYAKEKEKKLIFGEGRWGPVTYKGTTLRMTSHHKQWRPERRKHRILSAIRKKKKKLT